MTMRRIALISEHASPLDLLGGVDRGGQNVYVGQLARHLAASGYQVDIFTRRDSPLLPEVVDWIDGVRIIHVPAGPPTFVPKEQLLKFMSEFTDFFVRFCRRQQRPYDLVHANFWMSGLVAAEAKQALGLPFVITFHALGRVRRLHQGAADGFPDERFPIEDRLVAEAAQIIAECPQDHEDLVQLYQADPARITIVPCGFDQAEFWPINKALARAALGFEPDQRLILQLGRMVPRKGIDTVIRGFARLVRELTSDARLVIVGGDSDQPDSTVTPELGRLQALTIDEGVANLVTFTGRRGREALKYYYSAADVFVTTPWYEPFGITPLEAMACGTPVIGANVGGIKFAVRDGETGYLIPPNDPQALAERLVQLYRNPPLLDVLGSQAVRHVNELFTWRKVADAVAGLYEQVLANRRIDRRGEQSDLAVVDRGFDAVVGALKASQRHLRGTIVTAAEMITGCFAGGNKLLICGNGGSAADAQHFAAELVGRFKLTARPGLPALALTADTTVLTAWANDVGFEQVFARQIEALGRAGDLLIGISTSGNSRNVLAAFEAAQRRGLKTIALLGGDGGDLHQLADLAVIVPSTDTQHIQEVQIVMIHLLCELVEEHLDTAHPLLAASPADARARDTWEDPYPEPDNRVAPAQWEIVAPGPSRSINRQAVNGSVKDAESSPASRAGRSSK
jgi:phosphoheptose isomerase